MCIYNVIGNSTGLKTGNFKFMILLSSEITLQDLHFLHPLKWKYRLSFSNPQVPSSKCFEIRKVLSTAMKSQVENCT